VAAFCQQFTTIERRVKIDGFEYDIIARDRKVAIEYDGLYWHSELAGYPRDRHLKKTEHLEADGWTVIHIFEDEWVRQRPIVENRLRHLLGGARRRVGARQCDVRIIKSSVSKPFLDKHHIQGSVAASHHLGLYLGDELLAVATFGVARFRRDFDWELLRFSGAEDVVVPGAIGRLVAHFRRSHGGSIVSYADRRWGRGTTYEAIGFELIGTSPPAYFYFKGDLRQSRLSFQKARLRDLPSYSPEKSEAQIMAEEGWNRIYDCGTRVFGLRA
jgi:very-short-patch-repair endonuclease